MPLGKLRSRLWPARCYSIVGVAMSMAVVGLTAHASAASGNGLHSDLRASALFNITQVWTVELRFTPDQWEAMEPKGGQNPFGPPGQFRRNPDGPRQPGGLPGRPGPEAFGPAMAIGQTLLQAGDSNRNQKLTKREFTDLARKWFGDWDTNQSGTLDMEKVRDGINSVMMRAGPGGPGGPPRPGGGPPIQGRKGQRNGVAAAMGIDFPTVQADLKFDGVELPAVTVRYKGNGTFMESRSSMKRSLKVDLNDTVRGRRLAGVSKLNLHNNVTDASWMNEVLSYRLYRDAGVPAPRTSYARVYVEVPGKLERTYLGLYSIVENIDRNFLEDRFGTRNGALFKPATREPFTDLGDDWTVYEQSYDPKTPLSKAEVARVLLFAKLVSHATDAEFEKRLSEFLDVDEFAKYMAVTVWLSTLDSILMIGQNFYVYLHPTTGKFIFIPWDLDHSFGQFPMGGTQEQRENLNIHKPWVGENLFLERVFKVPQFKERYLACLREFSKTIFRPERFHQQVDEIAAVIRPSVRDESEQKLARFDWVVAGESVPRMMPGGGPERANPPPEIFPNGVGPNERMAPPPFFGLGPTGNPPEQGMAGQGEQGRGPVVGFGGFGQPDMIKPIKAFVIARAKSVNDQLDGKTPALSESMRFPGFGGPGGPGGANDFRDFRPPPGFGPGMFIGPALLNALDKDKDGRLTADEFVNGFGAWFDSWDKNRDGQLVEEELRTGLISVFSAFDNPNLRPGFPFGGPNPPGPPLMPRD